MKRMIQFAVVAAFLVVSGNVQAAEEWGLPNERKARFDAKVVDVLCELTGNCPPNCGDGKRQLGLLTEEGKLVLPYKNTVPFAGAAAELSDFCGRVVTADGLFSTNRGHTVFALQYVRPKGGKWRRANRFTAKWAKQHGVPAKSKKAQNWFRHDPRVMREISKGGKLGLGPDADRKYLKEN